MHRNSSWKDCPGGKTHAEGLHVPIIGGLASTEDEAVPFLLNLKELNRQDLAHQIIKVLNLEHHTQVMVKHLLSRMIASGRWTSLDYRCLTHAPLLVAHIPI